MMSELDCYFAECTGTLAYYGNDDNDPALYRCQECGHEYIQENVKRVAEMGGPLSEVAKLLLGGYGDD